MILDDLRVLFVHIARTGGTSIEAALAGQDWWNISPETKHLSARQLRALAGEDRWSSYFKFTIVRNPWDRIISMLATGWWNSDERNPKADLISFLTTLSPHTHEKYSSLFYADIIDEELDLIVRFEELQSGFDRICERLNKPAFALPRKEARDHLHYSAYYTDEARDCVGKLFAKDIAQYGYSFERAEIFNQSALSLLLNRSG